LATEKEKDAHRGSYLNEEKIIVICPNCQQKLGLPKRHEALKVSCPKCHTTFRYKFPSIIEKKRKLKWYYRSWFVILLLFIFTPVGIILLWSGSRFRVPVRIGLSIAFGLFFVNQSINYIFTPSYRDYSPSPEYVERIYLPSAPMEPVELSFGELREREEKLTVPQIVERVGRAIVFIESQDKNHNVLGRGSGVIIHRAGIIVTNYHVLKGAHFAEVKLQGDEIYHDVFVIGEDKQKDLAIMRIRANNLPAAPLGDSTKVKIGEKVIAIGNPLGYERTVSDGIISGVREIEGVNYLQITTPISPGSSGGALLNIYGEVVGITSMGHFDFAQNLNFAVPINYVHSLLEIEDR